MRLRVNESHLERHKGHEAEASSAPHISFYTYRSRIQKCAEDDQGKVLYMVTFRT